MTTKLMRNREAYQSKIPKIKIRRSIFDAKWSRKQTMNASYITPIMCKRVVPGQSMFLNLTNFVRLNTQVTCPIDNLQVETFAFYAPDRIGWDNFQYFIGAIKDPNNIVDYIVPQIEIPANKNTAGSLFNTLSASRIGKKAKVSAIPFRLHNLIYNEYFRDSDCESPKKVDKSDADGDINDYELYRIHKSRDYFTNSTRDIQKGEAVTLPLGTEAPVVGTGQTLGLTNNSAYVGLVARDLDAAGGRVFAPNENVYGQNTRYENITNTVTNGVFGVTTDPENSGLKAILNNATAATMQALRQSIMTEEYLEALNRGGTHYTDIMRNVYGVTIPDLRIQRPMYLGGTSAPLITSPVIQTSGTGTSGQNTPQGNIAGFGVGGDRGRIINASFEEFGYVIVYAVIKAQPQYQQGLERYWTEFDKYDMFNPFYTNLSDQAIKRSEIFMEDYDATDEDGITLNDKTFGYIGRYDHMRYFKNEIAGELNSEYQYTLDSWHYAEKFENAPENNADFMQDKTNEILDRSMAVRWEDEAQTIKAPQFICDFSFRGAVTVPIPTHAVPKIAAKLF